MIKLLPAFFLFLFMVLIMAIIPPRTSVAHNSSTTSKDSTENGQPVEFRKYWMVLLKKGPNQHATSQTTHDIMDAHLQNTQRLISSGKMVVAGPFDNAGTEEDIQGVFVLDCKDSLEAVQLLEMDTAVTTGIYTYELKSWETIQTTPLQQ